MPPKSNDDNDEEGLRAAGRSPQRYALRVRDVNECVVSSIVAKPGTSSGKGGGMTDLAPPPTKKAIVHAATAGAPMLEVEVTGSDDQDNNDRIEDTVTMTNRKRAVIIHSTVPRGFAIVDNDMTGKGKKIISTQYYKRGDLLYVASCTLLDLAPFGQRYELKIYTEEEEEETTTTMDETCGDENTCGSRNRSSSSCSSRRGARVLDARVNTDTLCVEDNGQHNDPRQVYGWDTFMTHSCEPNAYFPPLRKTRAEYYYKAIALRDVYAGDEITCDYATFDYSVVGGQEMEVCVCGSTNCRGRMVGFQNLSLPEKVDVLHLVDPEVRTKFLDSTNIQVFRSRLPDGIGIVVAGEQKFLVATRVFEVGDILFENRIIHIMRSHGLDDEYLLEVDEGLHITYHLLGTDEHFIHRTDYVEMIGFDCFMQHSCSPNAHQVYRDGTEYVLYATKMIVQGGTITCDYMALDNQAVGLESRPTIEFQCLCGEKNCRGILRC